MCGMIPKLSWVFDFKIIVFIFFISVEYSSYVSYFLGEDVLWTALFRGVLKDINARDDSRSEYGSILPLLVKWNQDEKRTDVWCGALAIIQINEYNVMRGTRRRNMEYLTTIEMSKRWGITSRRIAVLCEQGRIAGVVKKGKTWLIPYDSEKPEDARKNNHSKRGVLEC